MTMESFPPRNWDNVVRAVSRSHSSPNEEGWRARGVFPLNGPGLLGPGEDGWEVE